MNRHLVNLKLSYIRFELLYLYCKTDIRPNSPIDQSQCETPSDVPARSLKSNIGLISSILRTLKGTALIDMLLKSPYAQNNTNQVSWRLYDWLGFLQFPMKTVLSDALEEVAICLFVYSLSFIIQRLTLHWQSHTFDNDDVIRSSPRAVSSRAGQAALPL